MELCYYVHAGGRLILALSLWRPVLFTSYFWHLRSFNVIDVDTTTQCLVIIKFLKWHSIIAQL